MAAIRPWAPLSTAVYKGLPTERSQNAVNRKLKPCAACGHEVSKQAATCPLCGNLNRLNLDDLQEIGLLLTVVALIIWWVWPR